MVRDSNSGADVGIDESWSWRCVLRVERTVSWWERMDVSVVLSLMEASLQNLDTSCVHIDVGQIRCVPDDVFMITLIKRWRRNDAMQIITCQGCCF